MAHEGTQGASCWGAANAVHVVHAAHTLHAAHAAHVAPPPALPAGVEDYLQELYAPNLYATYSDNDLVLQAAQVGCRCRSCCVHSSSHALPLGSAVHCKAGQPGHWHAPGGSKPAGVGLEHEGSDCTTAPRDIWDHVGATGPTYCFWYLPCHSLADPYPRSSSSGGGGSSGSVDWAAHSGCVACRHRCGESGVVGNSWRHLTTAAARAACRSRAAAAARPAAGHGSSARKVAAARDAARCAAAPPAAKLAGQAAAAAGGNG